MLSALCPYLLGLPQRALRAPALQVSDSQAAPLSLSKSSSKTPGNCWANRRSCKLGRSLGDHTQAGAPPGIPEVPGGGERGTQAQPQLPVPGRRAAHRRAGPNRGRKPAPSLPWVETRPLVLVLFCCILFWFGFCMRHYPAQGQAMVHAQSSELMNKLDQPRGARHDRHTLGWPPSHDPHLLAFTLCVILSA